MPRHASLRGLWVCTAAILVTSAYQALGGHWISFFLFWPGFESLQHHISLLGALASLHGVLGFLTCALSIPLLVFAFLSKPNVFVRIFAAVGFAMVFVAVLGGYPCVTSMFKDPERLALPPLRIMVQVGTAVGLGIMIDTFVVRSLLVPAIATLVGQKNWWPSKSGLKVAEPRRQDIRDRAGQRVAGTEH